MNREPSTASTRPGEKTFPDSSSRRIPAKPGRGSRSALRGAILFCLGLFTGCATPDGSGRLSVRSPDGTIEARIDADGPLTYAVAVDGKTVLDDSHLGFRLRPGFEFGQDVNLVQARRRSTDQTWENPFGKRRHVRDRHNELRLSLRENSNGKIFEVILRAFDDGIAFRYTLPPQPGWESFVVEHERTTFAFPGNYLCYAGQHERGRGFRGPQEWEFAPQHLADLQPQSVVGLPLLVQTPAVWVALTESDLRDWAGLWLGRSLSGTNRLASVALEAKLAPRPDGQGAVKAAATRASPWRVLMIGRGPGRLIESDLVLNLASPCELADTSWIRPGMMAWDHWWSGDVQMDTATLKQYVQLASDMGWPYQLVDWWWYGEPNRPTSDLRRVNPAVDLDEVRRFAADKNVRLWLWVRFNDLERFETCDEVFARFQSWGIAGVKIDFMDRDDQEMVNWYERITRSAAAHRLMIDFHGAFKTSGFNRTFPNQVTREGILGNEYNRWSARVTPEHKLTLPFTRFLAGPADFTPGGFRNRQPAQFSPNSKRAEVQGTRAAELALFVLYDSPVCCACDHPDQYRGQPGADFLKIVPTVWDDTRVLDGAVARHLVMARRSGTDWFLAALTDRTPREVPVKLDFLGPGRWRMRLWKDAPDSDANAEHLEVEDRDVNSADTLLLRLSPAGGAAARLQKR